MLAPYKGEDRIESGFIYAPYIPLHVSKFLELFRQDKLRILLKIKQCEVNMNKIVKSDKNWWYSRSFSKWSSKCYKLRKKLIKTVIEPL